jgi:hypothetical protein
MVYTRISGGTGFWNETAMYRLAKAMHQSDPSVSDVLANAIQT